MTGTSDDLDELLQPTVARTRTPRKRPWHLQSQFWVAFFGGVPAITIITYINAGRLGMPERKREWIAAIGVLATIAFAAAAAIVGSPAERSALRIGGRVLAVVIYLLFAAMQRPADRHYLTLGSGEYAPLWNAGLVAILAGVVMNMAIVAVAIALFR